MKATHAETVYGADADVVFFGIKLGVAFVENGGKYYKYFFNDKNQLVRKGGPTVYVPMTRIDDSADEYVINDYPDT